MKTAIRLLLAIFTLLLMINATSADVEFVEIDWNELETSITPEGRFDGGMAYMDATDQILLFGGMSLEGPVSESAIYNVGDETWNFLEIDGPSARYGHSMVYEPKSGYVLLFGGSDGTTIFGDTWQFDPKTLSWSELMAGNGFASVNGDMTVDDKGLIYYFGGDSGDNLSNKLWVINLQTENPRWDIVDTASDSPSGRQHLSLQFLAESNQILIFGGITSDGGLEDTWIFDFSTFEWSVIEDAGVPNSFEYYSWSSDV
ncbi:MAG: Kelch repeat-containing protein, partial [Candidatus Kariarchaeaceae archaeon]